MWLASAGNEGTVKLWDARQLTAAIKAEVEAVELLGLLFSRPFPGSEVRAVIEKQAILSEAVRRQALELIDRFHEETDPAQYHAAAWPVLRHPHTNRFVLQTALAQTTAACAKAPSDDEYRRALAVAHYRLGKFQKEHYAQALEVLGKCDPGQPATLAFLAMTQHQLAQQAEAQGTLGRLQQLLSTERWARDLQGRAFLSEAEALLQPAAAAKLR
jgi:hypothetical protein